MSVLGKRNELEIHPQNPLSSDSRPDSYRFLISIFFPVLEESEILHVLERSAEFLFLEETQEIVEEPTTPVQSIFANRKYFDHFDYSVISKF